MTILTQIDVCMRRTGRSATRIGRESVRDPRLVFDLRRGRQLRAETRARVLQYLNLAGGAQDEF